MNNMSSEMFRAGLAEGIAPVLWRVIQSCSVDEKRQPSIGQQLEQKFQEGRQEGLSEAIVAASKESDLQLQPVLERLARSIQDLSEERARVRAETAADLVRLSIAIAARILHREITLDPDAIHGLLKAAFDKVQSREITRISVHPGHAPAVRRYLEQAAAGKRIEIVADPAVRSGQIALETEQGEIDASLETQLSEIERGLADRLNH
jgi:flagellar assembly protein FliH